MLSSQKVTADSRGAPVGGSEGVGVLVVATAVEVVATVLDVPDAVIVAAVVELAIVVGVLTAVVAMGVEVMATVGDVPSCGVVVTVVGLLSTGDAVDVSAVVVTVVLMATVGGDTVNGGRWSASAIPPHSKSNKSGITTSHRRR